MKTKLLFTFGIVIFSLCACDSGRENGKTSMPSETASEYNEASKLVQQIERKAEKVLTDNADIKDLQALYESCERLHFDYDPMEMDPESADKCGALQRRIDSVKYSVNMCMDKLRNRQLSVIYDVEQEVLETVKAFPLYLERGDMLFIAVDMENMADIRIYNADNRKLIKTYVAKRSVLDSLDINYKGVYFIEVKPRGQQYADVRIAYRASSVEHMLHPKQVEIETVEAKKGDFMAYSQPGIQMKKIFDEPRKFTLRSQLKATFSNTMNSDRAIVALQIPAGSTDVLYSLRISTNEGNRSSDGQFGDNLAKSYKKIKFLGLPVYERESNRGSSIISLLLGENQPPREEEAYINVYVFYNAAQARKFQDGADVTKLQYNIDYSMMGTQSCNGRIPTKGYKTIYLGFRNERVRYNNYVWLEAVSSVPRTEYFKPNFIVK